MQTISRAARSAPSERRAWAALLVVLAVVAAALTGAPRSADAAVMSPLISGTAHVQRIGDQKPAAANPLSLGTSGRALRVEGMTLRLANAPGSSIVYRVHIQKEGWQGWRQDGAFAGSRGKSQRLEGFYAYLTGPLADRYVLQYRAHVQRIGWQPWRNGGTGAASFAGTSGQSLRMEQLDFRLVPKSDAPVIETRAADRLRVSWNKEHPAGTPLRVVLGRRLDDLNTARDVAGAVWRATFSVPAGRKNVDIPLNAAWRNAIGQATGMSVAAQLQRYDAGSRTWVSAGTVVDTMVPTPQAAAASTAITVATYNVGSVKAVTSVPWSTRGAAVARTIDAVDPALVALQELNADAAGTGRGNMIQDLDALLTRHQAVIPGDRFRPSSTSVPGAHLFYDPAHLRLQEAATVSTKQLVGDAVWNVGSSTADQPFEWARFTVAATGRPFCAVSVHLTPNDTSSAAVARRRAAVERISAYMTERAPACGDLVLLADFNDSIQARPSVSGGSYDGTKGAQARMIQLGWTNAAAAAARTNIRYKSAESGTFVANGVPGALSASELQAEWIDGIYTRGVGSAFSYGVDVRLSGGRFDPAFHGSDHNLVWARIPIQ
ncbi:endonuclease/exonuclease/phosphatase family protein [Microbacterium sp. NPDC096154]|uniref:endonuclease/exonuclease/phosphatase family protein n=1 Tax=Microbacterium sp. NPDC096154 TaxID=3155549 RepID=UPI00332E851E